MDYRFIFIISSFLLSGLTLSAQSSGESYERGQSSIESIMPPTPEAASVVKFADVPFTHSIGAAELSIPIWTLEGRELKIPMSISYHSNGIKVDEIAGGNSWIAIYDDRGRMTHETHHNRSFDYNYLDLPSIISSSGSDSTKISYIADGMKVSMLNLSGEGLVYLGDFVYRRSSSGSLSFESTPFCGGRMTSEGVRYYITDYLGSVRAVIGGAGGNTLEASDYTAYGDIGPAPLNTVPGNEEFRYHFTGKEDLGPEFSLPFTDFGARLYSNDTHRWITPDPLSEKYYDVSPYVYCAGNPVMIVDPDGRHVWPKGVEELEMIRNTLPEEARDYVQLNDAGFIDRELIHSYQGRDYNLSCLTELIDSDIIITVSLADSFSSIDKDGNQGNYMMSYYGPDDDLKDTHFEYTNGLTTGEGGLFGKVLFPDRDGIQNSSTSNIEVYVNSSLSRVGAAEAFSHEGYGHALLYLRTGCNHEAASHHFIGGTESNSILRNMILNSRRQTIKNMNMSNL